VVFRPVAFATPCRTISSEASPAFFPSSKILFFSAASAVACSPWK